MKPRYVFITMILILITAPSIAHAGLTASPSSIERNITFNQPRGALLYQTSASVIVEGPNGTTLDVVYSGLQDVAIVRSPTTPVINNNYVSIEFTFKIYDNASEGSHSGTLTISGGGNETTVSVNLNVIYPDPRLTVYWDSSNLGKLKAGMNYTRKVTVNETMGYNPAEGVVLSFYDGVGPAKFFLNGSIGDVQAFGSKTIEVVVNVPDRGLKPGNYNVTNEVESNNSVDVTGNGTKYEIINPVMDINVTEIDFGEITFEPNKDKADRTLEIKETGGFTPIEGIRFFQVSGEEGWVSLPSQDYVPAGNSEKFNFTVTLPEDASIGERQWSFNILTDYAGTEVLVAKVIVSFPGIEDAIKQLQEMDSLTLVKNYADAETLRESSIDLLENSRRITDLGELAKVMSIFSGARTFLNQVDAVLLNQDGDLKKAGDSIIKAKPALNKIKIGDENLEDEELKLYSGKAADSAEKLWDLKASEIISALDEQAKELEESNYKFSALYYKRISKIYSLLGENSKAQDYAGRQAKIEEVYKNALSDAVSLKGQAEVLLKDTRSRMFSIGNYYMIVNPLQFESISDGYKMAIERYEATEGTYRKAGEINDAEAISKELEDISRERTIAFTAFVAYGLFWVVVFIFVTARIILGFQIYSQDEKDEVLGDIVIGVE